MRLKRVTSLFTGVLLALCCAGLLGCGAASAQSALAYAEKISSSEAVGFQKADPRDTLSVSPSASPSGMAVPQPTQIYLTIVNSATDPITNIRVLREDGELAAEIGALSGSGQSSRVFNETVTPTYRQLRAGGVEYTVSYTLGEGGDIPVESEQTVLVPLTRLKAEPKLEFTRSPSANYAQPGEEITITYRLRNTGNVALTDLVLRDSLFDEISRVDQLAPGKRVNFTRKLKVEETCESKPQVSYSYANAEARQSVKPDPVMIYLADERLDMKLTCDKSAVAPGELVTLSLELTNRGNVAYDKLEIRDQALGYLSNVPGEFKPGNVYVLTKRVSIKTTTTFLLSLSGKSVNGSETSARSNMLTVAVSPAVNDINLSITAEPDAVVLDAPGPVNFKITIHNGGEMDIRNVKLSERTLGEIRMLAVAAPGDTVVEQQYIVEQPHSFVFIADLSDAQGGRLSVLTKPPIDISLKESAQIYAGASPDVTAVLGLDNTAYHMDDNANSFNRMVTMVLAVLAVLVGAILVGAGIRFSRRRKLKKLRLRKLRRSNRNARLENASEQKPISPDDDTGVYKKADLAPR